MHSESENKKLKKKKHLRKKFLHWPKKSKQKEEIIPSDLWKGKNNRKPKLCFMMMMMNCFRGMVG